MSIVHGVCAPEFEAVRSVLEKNLATGQDVGASVAIALHGELVVDLWGGLADPMDGRAWERDTITNVWSTTKTMSVLSALLLVDRGELDFDAPVARYWPEFAAAGKSGVLLRHILGHTSGLPAWDEKFDPSELGDWDKMTGLLAQQQPWWTPGDGSGYHGLTQGFLIGELVRRTTGQTLPDFFRQELAAPLEADFHILVPESAYGRISPVIGPSTLVPADREPDDREDILSRIGNPPYGPESANTDWWRRAGLGAGGGHGNARSVATIQSVLSNGGEIGGRRFLSQKTCDSVFAVQSDGVDRVMGTRIRWGMGFALSSPGSVVPVRGRVNESTCYWGGWGGSFVTNDLRSHMTVAYVMNQMQNAQDDTRGVELYAAAQQSLAHSD